MDIDQFFEKLPRDGWRLDEVGQIRRIDDPSCCPHIMIRNLLRNPAIGPFHPTDYEKSWKPIWNAADYRFGRDPALRARLLAHCKLPPDQEER